MKSIQVNSLPLKDVIVDISKAFKVKYNENCGQYYLKIPNHIGKGDIRGINFNGGLGILQYDCMFKEDIEIQFIVNEVHPLKFLYCLDGKLNHRFENDTTVHNIIKYQEAIVASDSYNGHILHFEANVHTVINSLEVDREKFQQKIACELKSMDRKLQNLFNDIKAKETFYHDGFYSLQLADLFMEMQSFKGKYFIRKLFLEGKAYQMLTKQILLYKDDLMDVENRSMLRQSEIQQIERAATLIRDEISDLETIDAIAVKVGLNTNKLQEGFQHLYNVTVNQFIQKVRLDLGKDLILNTEYNISEIVDLVGLSSKSYFSKIFKEKYKTTPSEYRKHYLDALIRKKTVKAN